ncbi:MAG: hypothetical protein NT069_12125 [Planctomycetota bacterium]|nr:hypothetical protein [Planctomycetota bacterium]
MFFPEIPIELPRQGLIIENDDGLRFGVWVMPDNERPGRIESYLSQFGPGIDDTLWQWLKEHCLTARGKVQAPFKEAHFDKAVIYSWLAVQDEPGEQLHIAIKKGLLRPRSPVADPFVNWFRKLFDV